MAKGIPGVTEIIFEDSGKPESFLEGYMRRTTRGERLRNTFLGLGLIATTAVGANEVAKHAPQIMDSVFGGTINEASDNMREVFHNGILFYDGPDCIASDETFYLPPGRTLWNAATEMNPDSTHDPRQIVDEIRCVNGIESGDIVMPGYYNVPVID